MEENLYENSVSVYILARFHKGKMTRPVKIGIAANPHQRAKEINTSSPFKVAVYHTFPCPDRECASLLESAFHKVMDCHRLHGEWFRMDAEAAVTAMAQNYFNFLCHYMKMDSQDAGDLVFSMMGGR